MVMSWDEISERQSEIRKIFRSWVLNTERINSPEWMSSAEYELLHQCVREVFTLQQEDIITIHKES